jgi:hypothetical protein
MKYKVGDTVRIRSKEWMDAQRKDADGDIAMNGLCLTKGMFMYAGRTATIKRICPNRTYKLDIDNERYWWMDWMFDPDYKADGLLSAKDAIIAMVREGEHLFDKDGREFYWDDGGKIFWHTLDAVNDAGKEYTVRGSNFPLPDLYRRPSRRKRTMNRWEVLDWAGSDASRGWLVRASENMPWILPAYYGYNEDFSTYQRARLLPDLSGVDEDTIQGFEVEE